MPPSDQGPENYWAAYWDREKIFGDELASLGGRQFVRASSRYMDYRPDDALLDIGCGTGHVAEQLSSHVGELVGIDTSPRSVAICKRRLKERSNASFALLPADRPFDFGFLAPRKFQKIICVSVVQYYAEIEDLARLIAAVRSVAAPGARLLVADILMTGSVLSDTVGSLIGAIRAGCVLEKIKFLTRAASSEYLTHRRRNRLLTFDEKSLDLALRDFGARGTLIHAQLTLNSRRRHVLYRF
ncbi:MAG: methyltransferase domain-containing protein [Hyphomicrobiales bacterium]|nr:methyltransferase domain-containing protein [Hyphomicrobiales bacterium]